MKTPGSQTREKEIAKHQYQKGCGLRSLLLYSLFLLCTGGMYNEIVMLQLDIITTRQMN